MTVKLPIDLKTSPDGVLLVLSVRYVAPDGEWKNPITYQHAALKNRGRWHVTGSGPQDASWSAVERWLGRDNRELVRVELATTQTIWLRPGTTDEITLSDDRVGGFLDESPGSD